VNASTNNRTLILLSIGAQPTFKHTAPVLLPLSGPCSPAPAYLLELRPCGSGLRLTCPAKVRAPAYWGSADKEIPSFCEL
jgi:hypothetical protein